MIEIFPAIDLHNGQAVRLRQGDYNQVEVFFKNPVEVLDFFNRNNSKNLHIVDLDGAKDGNTKNYEVIKELVEKSDFLTNSEIISKFENQITKNPELFSQEHLSALLELIKKVTNGIMYDKKKKKKRLQD